MSFCDHEGPVAALYSIPLYLPQLDQDIHVVDSLEGYIHMYMYYRKILTCEETEHLDVEVVKWKSVTKECQFKRDQRLLLSNFRPTNFPRVTQEC